MFIRKEVNMPENGNGGESTAKDKKSRHRSPNYPGIGLRQAVAKIDAIYKEDKLAPSPKAAALKHMGYENPHGEAGRVVSALKSFGLIEEANDRFKFTQRGIDILARPDGDSQRLAALQQAAISPAIYRDLLKDYADSGLPSDTALRSELIAVKKFNPNAVDAFIRDFRDTLEFAGISDLAMLGLDVEELESGNMPTETSPEFKSKTYHVPTPPLSNAPPPSRQTPAPEEISTPVGREDDRVVFARVSFDAGIRKEFISSLKKYLDYLETTLQ
jgi:hypothetical protein